LKNLDKSQMQMCLNENVSLSKFRKLQQTLRFKVFQLLLALLVMTRTVRHFQWFANYRKRRKKWC